MQDPATSRFATKISPHHVLRLSYFELPEGLEDINAPVLHGAAAFAGQDDVPLGDADLVVSAIVRGALRQPVADLGLIEGLEDLESRCRR